VAGSCIYGDESSGSGAMELASSTATKHHSTHVRSYASTERKSYREIQCVGVHSVGVQKP
jgi:hypothetical protein